MDTELLRIENLTTSFTTSRGVAKAVDDLSLSMFPGQTLALVGESGCGKTMLSLSILRLVPDPPGKITQGRILFQNRDLLGLSETEMQKVRGRDIAMVFQEPMTALNPVFTVGEQIAEMLLHHKKISRAQAKEQTVELLRLVNLSEPAKQAEDYPHRLSGGMRQRVMIAMALSCKPALILADEPTTALDVTVQAQILDLLLKLKEKQGLSLLLVTHDLGLVAQNAQAVAVMYAGKIVEHAGVNELFASPLHPYTVGLLQSLPRLDREDRTLKPIPGSIPDLAELPQGCPFHPRCPKRLSPCSAKHPPLVEKIPGHFVRCWLYA